MTTEALSIEDARALFVPTGSSVYLSTCTRGLLPEPARASLDGHLEGLTRGDIDKSALFAATEQARTRFAQLIGCEADEVAYTKNVSDGLNMIAGAIDWRRGDNVVVCLELEHPNNVYPWLNVRDRIGIEVRTVAASHGHVDIDRLLSAVDAHTRLVTLPTVSFAPGFVADAARVGNACRARDVPVLVDAVQSVGVLHTDVDALRVDALAVSTQKGLCGLYGMGFLYCRRGFAETLRPAALARFGVNLGEDAHEAQFGSTDYRLMDAARRFDLGNYNYPAILAVNASLSILQRVGSRTIDSHNRRLASRLIEGLLERGHPVTGGPPGVHTGSIVCIGTPGGGHDSSEDPHIRALSARLQRAGVQHTIRRGMLRLAVHLYNTDADIEHVLDAC